MSYLKFVFSLETEPFVTINIFNLATKQKQREQLVLLAICPDDIDVQR